MESYVEVTFINNVFIMMLAMMISSSVSLKPITIKQAGIYAFCISLYAVVIWMPLASIGMLLLELIFFIFLFKRHIGFYLYTYVVRLLTSISFYIFFKGSFHVGIYFVPMNVSIYFVWLFMIIAFLALYHKWNSYVSELQYVYEIKIHPSKRTLKLYGYLDTGNLIIHEGLPVIFLDMKYKSYFVEENIELIVVNSIHETSILKCYEVDISMSSQKKQRVYVCVEQALQLQYRCVCLLNMKMLAAR